MAQLQLRLCISLLRGGLLGGPRSGVLCWVESRKWAVASVHESAAQLGCGWAAGSDSVLAGGSGAELDVALVQESATELGKGSVEKLASRSVQRSASGWAEGSASGSGR
jgi:hypothetical protein